jgi:hypothetical protein
MTVTLHEPVLRPLRVDPDTLQYFADLETTFKVIFEVGDALSFAYRAIDLTDAALDIVTLGVPALGVVNVGVLTLGVVTIGVVNVGVLTLGVVTIGVVNVGVLGAGAGVDVVFQPGIVCFTEVLDPSPFPFHDEVTKS